MQFAKEIRLLLPNSIRLNRGNTVLPTLCQSCLSTSTSDLILLHEHRGTPTALTISHFPHGPTAMFSLHNVVLRHDLPDSARGTVSESYPHLIFEGFSTPLGKRVVTILKHLFPPREAARAKEGSRVVTFALADGDFISVRHHVYVRTGYNSVELAEVGPRMEMKVNNDSLNRPCLYNLLTICSCLSSAWEQLTTRMRSTNGDWRTTPGTFNCYSGIQSMILTDGQDCEETGSVVKYERVIKKWFWDIFIYTWSRSLEFVKS